MIKHKLFCLGLAPAALACLCQGLTAAETKRPNPPYMVNAPVSAGEIAFEVDAAKVLRTGADRFVGIDLNYIRDLDVNRDAGAQSLDQALTGMGARWLRYPGGEKSDFHLFALPPYTKPAPQSLGWYEKAKGERMDFDAYIACCKAVKAEPFVVVGCDNEKRTGRNWDQWLEHAVAWVRYANVMKKYGVKHWEIGNENWQNQTASPEEMARVVARFAKAMKAVDPAIEVGSSGRGEDWWKVFLPIAGPHIDFLTVSVYNCPGWKSYDYYPQHPRADLLAQAGVALRAIDNCASEADRRRLRVVVAETNSKDYSKGGWPGINSMGHALVSFETFGRLMAEPRIKAAMLWTTRWLDDRQAAASQWFALRPDNRLMAIGQAVALWGRHVRASLVEVRGGSDLVGGYASADEPRRALTVWIVNRGREEAPNVRVSLRGPAPFGAATVSCFHGTGPDDTKPVVTQMGQRKVEGNTLDILACPGVSVTVLEFGR